MFNPHGTSFTTLLDTSSSPPQILTHGKARKNHFAWSYVIGKRHEDPRPPEYLPIARMPIRACDREHVQALSCEAHIAIVNRIYLSSSGWLKPTSHLGIQAAGDAISAYPPVQLASGLCWTWKGQRGYGRSTVGQDTGHISLRVTQVSIPSSVADVVTRETLCRTYIR
ncbi:hypothetical protein NUW54_g3543 [Trametes sanguinea]|uniref:Uncharacterized protein n=1 Tax=Trametes sanguinea TaxID=158606 RepID=A0ACC1Q420_9APHY|nr:hypothetical protein NUW54_g3543 [Trametes sanguinea]